MTVNLLFLIKVEVTDSLICWQSWYIRNKIKFTSQLFLRLKNKIQEENINILKYCSNLCSGKSTLMFQRDVNNVLWPILMKSGSSAYPVLGLSSPLNKLERFILGYSKSATLIVGYKVLLEIKDSFHHRNTVHVCWSINLIQLCFQNHTISFIVLCCGFSYTWTDICPRNIFLYWYTYIKLKLSIFIKL